MSRNIFGPDTLIGNAPSNVVAGERHVEIDPELGTLPVINPATGKRIADVPSANKELIEKAVQLAVRAQREWAKTSHLHRASVLERIKQSLADHTEELATIVSLEQGKPIADARGE
ncbi:MAG: aldehyde dehydrogenase family protein, partial [Hoeflea sp.]|uniref:aldehyde dehydrogenase family protein n=1 Tax=Hoeflea sp. TaxID=1940281 RepID=UPI003EFAF410